MMKKMFLLMKTALWVAMTVLLLGASSAQADSASDLEDLRRALAALQAQVDTQKTKIVDLEAANTSQNTQMTNLREKFNSQSTRVSSLEATISGLQTKLAPVSVSGNDFTISGKNVRIIDGSGATRSTSGLGNLTVGYNELKNSQGINIRTGSHNLVLGSRNNYSSHGGFIAGEYNAIAAPCASVSGGAYNTASGYGSSVSGSAGNTASGFASSVSGGYVNTAGGDRSSVSGGRGQNIAAPGPFPDTTGRYDWKAGSLFQDQ